MSVVFKRVLDFSGNRISVERISSSDVSLAFSFADGVSTYVVLNADELDSLILALDFAQNNEIEDP